MSKETNSETLRQAIRLLHHHPKHPHLSANEFIDQVLSREIATPTATPAAAKVFLLVNKHSLIFDCLIEDLFQEYNLKIDTDAPSAKMALYLLIFELSEATYDEVLDLMKRFKPTLSVNLIKNFLLEEFLVLLTEVSSRVFDNDYVMNVLVRKVLDKAHLFRKLHSDTIQYHAQKNRPLRRARTIPRSPKFAPRHDRFKETTSHAPEPPATTISPSPIPPTNYEPEKGPEVNLERAKLANKNAAKKLLDEANAKPFRVAKLTGKKASPPPVTPRKRVIVKPHKIPKHMKDVEVKTNTALVMRQAALYVKQQEKEIKKLESLTSGAFDDSIFTEWENEERKKMEQEYIQKIEKNHLEGLLTYEEMLAAKQKVVKENKKKMLEVKEQRQELMCRLEEWKKEEQEKMKEVVERIQESEKNARQAEKRVQEEKQERARIIAEESRQLAEEALVQKQAELAKKMELIKELKTFENARALYQKEYDPTETCNLGLLCEMSVAELQERLGFLRLQLKEELEEKRRSVAAVRQERRELVESAQEYIEQNRVGSSRCGGSGRRRKKAEPVKVEETKEIAELKRRIDALRKSREKRACD